MKKKETKKSNSSENKNTQIPHNEDSVNQIEKDLRRPEPPRFQVQFDMSYGGTYVTKEGKSMTVPDMNLTVRQLLQNHSRGLSNDRHLKDPLYFDIQIPKIKDITDVYEYKDYLKNQLEQTEQWLKSEKEEDKKRQVEELEKLNKEKLKQLRIDDDEDTSIKKPRDLYPDKM